MNRISQLGVLGLVLLALGACGKKSTGTGTVTVQFTNGATLNALEYAESGAGLLSIDSASVQPFALSGATPTVFKMKLVAMYLVENIDPTTSNNVGALTRIWTSKKCDADLTKCGLGPAAGDYIVDYFDFAQSSADVNAALNSYARDTKESTVNAGTFRYIRMDFQGATGSQDPTVANMKFGNATTAYEVRAQSGSIDVKLTDPLVIAAGDTVTVNLAYDISNSFYAAQSSLNTPAEVTTAARKYTCSGSANPYNCMAEPIYTPTVTKK